jgi:hypothetical protein
MMPCAPSTRTSGQAQSLTPTLYAACKDQETNNEA